MSVTAPLGFLAAGVAAGLKPSGQPDTAVVLNEGPSRSAAAVFTGNRVQAAPRPFGSLGLGFRALTVPPRGPSGRRSPAGRA